MNSRVDSQSSVLGFGDGNADGVAAGESMAGARCSSPTDDDGRADDGRLPSSTGSCPGKGRRNSMRVLSGGRGRFRRAFLTEPDGSKTTPGFLGQNRRNKEGGGLFGERVYSPVFWLLLVRFVGPVLRGYKHPGIGYD